MGSLLRFKTFPIRCRSRPGVSTLRHVCHRLAQGFFELVGRDLAGFVACLEKGQLVVVPAFGVKIVGHLDFRVFFCVLEDIHWIIIFLSDSLNASPTAIFCPRIGCGAPTRNYESIPIPRHGSLDLRLSGLRTFFFDVTFRMNLTLYHN